MKRVIWPSLLLIASTTHAALPIEGWYGSLFGGYTYMPNNLSKLWGGLNRTDAQYQSGYNFGARIGYKSTPLRYEGEITYVSANLSGYKIDGYTQTGVNGDTDATLLMLNAYYDFPEMVPAVSPYINIGLGYGFVNTYISSTGPNVGYNQYNNSNGVFAYQGGLGLNYDFAECFGLNLGYRFVATERVEALGKMFEANIVSIGATYRFDEARYK